MWTAWHWACHGVYLCQMSLFFPTPLSQRKPEKCLGLQWFSLLDFFLTCRKSETWPWMMSWFWMWTPTPWKPPLMTSRASQMTWWVMSPWVLTPGSSCSGREHAFGEEKGWIQLWFSCSLRTAVGFCYLWNLCLSEGSWEVVHFLILFCSHNPHLKWPQGLDGPSFCGAWGSCHPHCHCRVQRAGQPPGVTPLKAGERASVWAIWGTSDLRFFSCAIIKCSCFPRSRVSTASALNVAPRALNLS